MDAQRILGGALSGLGDGLIEHARAQREAAKAKLERQQELADRAQDRAWEVEDRDLRLARTGGGSGGSGGGSSQGFGLIEGEDGTLTLAKGAPAAVVDRWTEAQAKARSEGRPGATWEDYNSVGGGESSADPDSRARMVQAEIERLREENRYADDPMSDDELLRRANESVDRYYGGGSKPKPGGGLAPTEETAAPEEDYPMVQRGGKHEVGKIYKTPDGRLVKYMGPNQWMPVDG